jgi:hypothetical protein
VRKAVESGRREPDGKRDALPQELRRRIDGGHVDQDAGAQLSSAKGGHVLAERDFICGPTDVVAVAGRLHLFACDRLEAFEVDDVFEGANPFGSGALDDAGRFLGSYISFGSVSRDRLRIHLVSLTAF